MNRVPEILNLKAEWDALQPLKQENESKLWKKLRLEWNYHSNHIEGNTLNYGETELLLIHGQTHGNHSLREYEEMQAHDVGIAHLRELANDKSRPLREDDIRNLNQIILKEPFWKHAQTADGKNTRKQIVPGEYKTTPNNVITATGELFEFAPPFDVLTRMQALTDWLTNALPTTDEQILPIITKLHHDFVLIHPFDDGNGRVARMLVNYVLMRQGYPPIIVPTEQKKSYLAALRLADAGDLTDLSGFLASCLIRSLRLGIKAGQGKGVEEPDDLEKEITLFVRSQEAHHDKVQAKSKSAIELLYQAGIKDLIARSQEKMKTFEPLFLKSKVTSDPHPAGQNPRPQENFLKALENGFSNPNHFHIFFSYEGFTGQANERFAVSTQLKFRFDEYDYSVIVANQTPYKKLYTEPLVSDERDAIIKALLAQIFDAIKKRTQTK